MLALLPAATARLLALPAALFLVPMSFISFVLVTLPLLVPALLLSGRYRRDRAGPGRTPP